MDPRHESFKEAFLNHLITTINFHIQEYLDALVKNPAVRHEIYQICEKIYRYLGIQVDVQGILSKHNLLSIDVVLFPHVADTESNQILTEIAFKQLILEIKMILDAQHTHSDHESEKLDENVNHLFHEYDL